MSTTSKTRALVAAVIFLVLTNIAVLVFFLCCKGPGRKDPHGGREAMMKEFLQKEIGFTPQQIQQYDTLSKQHREGIKASFDEMRNNKEQQFRELGRNAFSDSAISIAANHSSEMQKEMEVKMILHFKEIRKLCTPEQQPKFDSLFYTIWNKKDDKRKKPGE
jgi:Spy/CpxP family protein refolding chaperone